MAAPEAHIGLDFDNTIINYADVFRRVAIEQGIVPASSKLAGKEALRDLLRASGREREWTVLQGIVYGARICEAQPFVGVREFFAACARRGTTVTVISHRTKAPIFGEPYDLHAAAREWLEKSGLLGAEGKISAHFEETRAEKIARIREMACTFFVDDLPEVLLDPNFSETTRRVLFAPQCSEAAVGLDLARSWEEVRLLAGL